MSQADDPPAIRSRADRYGQLVFVLIACGLLGWGLLWAIHLIPISWLAATVGVIVAIGYFLVVVAGVVSALTKTKTPS